MTWSETEYTPAKFTRSLKTKSLPVPSASIKSFDDALFWKDAVFEHLKPKVFTTYSSSLAPTPCSESLSAGFLKGQFFKERHPQPMQ